MFEIRPEKAYIWCFNFNLSVSPEIYWYTPTCSKYRGNPFVFYMCGPNRWANSDCCWRKFRKFCMYILSKAIKTPVEKPLSCGRYVDRNKSSFVKSIFPICRNSLVIIWERSGHNALSSCCSTRLFRSSWRALRCSLRGFPRIHSRHKKRPNTLPTMHIGHRSHHGNKSTLIVMSTTPSEASSGRSKIQWKIEQSIYRSQNLVDERRVMNAIKNLGETRLTEHLYGRDRRKKKVRFSNHSPKLTRK